MYENLRKRHFALNCCQFIWIISCICRYRHWCKSPRKWLKGISTKVWQGRDILHLQNLFSKKESLQISVQLLLLSAHSNQCPLQCLCARFSKSNPSVHFKTVTLLAQAPQLLPTLCFQVATRSQSVSSWLWEFSSPKTSSAPFIQIYAFNSIYYVWW